MSARPGGRDGTPRVRDGEAGRIPSPREPGASDADRRGSRALALLALVLTCLPCALAGVPPAPGGAAIAPTPPMGWNDWAHY